MSLRVQNTKNRGAGYHTTWWRFWVDLAHLRRATMSAGSVVAVWAALVAR
jgi:hypothetical protein